MEGASVRVERGVYSRTVLVLSLNSPSRRLSQEGTLHVRGSSCSSPLAYLENKDIRITLFLLIVSSLKNT